jgi:geranylgeranyl diphosphate synthase type II
MDHAPTRRGRPTVHVRWGLNTALLSGDVLLGLAYRQLLRTRTERLPLLTSLFTTGVLEVCEGQALDLEYERRSDVTVREYFGMIDKKTGRLFSLSAELGGIIGGGSPTHVASLRRFGHYLGRAFQLQDDLLDVIANEEQFGKTIGGDIVEGKRTFLLLRAAERARGRDRTLLRTLLHRGSAALGPRRSVVRTVTGIYRRTGVLDETQREIASNTRRAVASLEALPAGEATALLRWLSEALVNRAS